MTNLIQEPRRSLKMAIKYISFDLDDTFWDVMPTIYRAEKLTTEWIKEHYPGAAKLLDSENIINQFR